MSSPISIASTSPETKVVIQGESVGNPKAAVNSGGSVANNIEAIYKGLDRPRQINSLGFI